MLDLAKERFELQAPRGGKGQQVLCPFAAAGSIESTGVVDQSPMAGPLLELV